MRLAEVRGAVPTRRAGRRRRTAAGSRPGPTPQSGPESGRSRPVISRPVFWAEGDRGGAGRGAPSRQTPRRPRERPPQAPPPPHRNVNRRRKLEFSRAGAFSALFVRRMGVSGRPCCQQHGPSDPRRRRRRFFSPPPGVRLEPRRGVSFLSLSAC